MIQTTEMTQTQRAPRGYQQARQKWEGNPGVGRKPNYNKYYYNQTAQLPPTSTMPVTTMYPRHYIIYNATSKPLTGIPPYKEVMLHLIREEYDELVAEEDEEMAKKLHGTRLEEEAELLEECSEWLF